MKWWILQKPGEDPYGVLALDDHLITRRYVPGVGLVPDPVDDDHIWKGELGARPVEQDEALALIASGKLPDVEYLDTSDVLPVPESNSVAS
jgi:hypothetical protein